MVEFTVAGIPATKGSKRHIGGGRMIESSKALKPWMEALKTAFKREYHEAPIDRPVKVTAGFFVPKPKKPKFNQPATPRITSVCFRRCTRCHRKRDLSGYSLIGENGEYAGVPEDYADWKREEIAKIKIKSKREASGSTL